MSQGWYHTQMTAPRARKRATHNKGGAHLASHSAPMIQWSVVNRLVGGEIY